MSKRNFINIKNIEWATDNENDAWYLPKSIVVEVSEDDFNNIIYDANCDRLVELISDFYNFCIESLDYDLDIPDDDYLPDVSLLPADDDAE